MVRRAGDWVCEGRFICEELSGLIPLGSGAITFYVLHAVHHFAHAVVEGVVGGAGVEAVFVCGVELLEGGGEEFEGLFGGGFVARVEIASLLIEGFELFHHAGELSDEIIDRGGGFFGISFGAGRGGAFQGALQQRFEPIPDATYCSHDGLLERAYERGVRRNLRLWWLFMVCRRRLNWNRVFEQLWGANGDVQDGGEGHEGGWHGGEVWGLRSSTLEKRPSLRMCCLRARAHLGGTGFFR
jgi:hypothetical protein